MNKPAQPGIPELIRHTYKTAGTPGPEQAEAIALLRSFGFDPAASPELLSDDYIFAVLDRASQSHTH
jgi:hypothetical protein